MLEILNKIIQKKCNKCHKKIFKNYQYILLKTKNF